MKKLASLPIIILALLASIAQSPGVAHAEVCSSWDSEIEGPTNADPNFSCICQQQQSYNHTLYVLNWSCLSSAGHTVDCGIKPCSDSTMRDEYSLLCDTQWCGDNQHYEWYGAEEHCPICL